MYGHLGSFVSRHWLFVILVWMVGAAAIAPEVQRQFGIHFTPTWDEVSKDGDLAYLPPRMTSVRGQKLYGDAFPDNKSRSEVVVVLERPEGLVQADLDFAQTIADYFEQEKKAAAALKAQPLTNEVRQQLEKHLAVVDVMRPAGNLEGRVAGGGADDLIGKKLISPDKQAVIIVASLEHELIAVDSARMMNVLGGSKKNNSLIAEKLEQAQNQAVNPVPAGLNWGLTGSAAIGGDSLLESDKSIEATHVTTFVLVVLILLVVYRAPILVVVPLITIGISVFFANHVIALLTQLHTVPGFGWFEFDTFKTSKIFIFIICFGSGTDFCLFLISRYKEELERGHGKAEALEESLGSVGEALTGSAMTTVCGLGMMYFADFGKFTYSGPAIAICLVITLIGCLTLAPAMLRACGKNIFWPFGLNVKQLHENEPVDATWMGRFWTWTSDRILARPGLIMFGSLLVMTPLAYEGLKVKVTYDLVSDLQPDVKSRRGTVLMQKHFPTGEMGPISILVASDRKFKLPSSKEWRDFQEAHSDLNPNVVRQVDEAMALDDPKKTMDQLKELANAHKELAPLLVFGFESDEGRRAITELTKELYATFPDQISSVRSLTYPLGDKPPEKRGGILDFTRNKTVSLHKESESKYVAKSGPYAGMVTRFDIVTNYDPFSIEAENLLGPLDPKLFASQMSLQKFVKNKAEDPDSFWHGAEFDFIGTTAGTRDLKQVVNSDEWLIQRLVVISVSAVVLFILRRPVICAYLIFTVVFSYLVTIGATELVFQWFYGADFQGLDWKVPIFLFVILVAVGEDYNIYLATRVFEEERRLGRIPGLRMAIIKTGGIITSCGVIMAGTFVSLMSGTLRAMHALGFALTLGVILDTFIVRPILVPAFLAWLYRLIPEKVSKVITPEELVEDATVVGGPRLETLTVPAAPHTEMARSRTKKHS